MLEDTNNTMPLDAMSEAPPALWDGCAIVGFARKAERTCRPTRSGSLPILTIVVFPPKHAHVAMINAGIGHTCQFHVDAVFNLVGGRSAVTGVRVYSNPTMRAEHLVASWKIKGEKAEKQKVIRGKIIDVVRLQAFAELESVAEQLVGAARMMVSA